MSKTESEAVGKSRGVGWLSKIQREVLLNSPMNITWESLGAP